LSFLHSSLDFGLRSGGDSCFDEVFLEHVRESHYIDLQVGLMKLVFRRKNEAFENEKKNGSSMEDDGDLKSLGKRIISRGFSC